MILNTKSTKVTKLGFGDLAAPFDRSQGDRDCKGRKKRSKVGAGLKPAHLVQNPDLYTAKN
jgi:hypothetical protein